MKIKLKDSELIKYLQTEVNDEDCEKIIIKCENNVRFELIPNSDSTFDYYFVHMENDIKISHDAVINYLLEKNDLYSTIEKEW